MEWWESIVLGLVQGLTEFLPVSSSGHLMISRDLLGIESDGFLDFTVTVHFATVLSTIVVFRHTIWDLIKGVFKFRYNDQTDYFLKICVSMIPAGVRRRSRAFAFRNHYRHRTHLRSAPREHGAVLVPYGAYPYHRRAVPFDTRDRPLRDFCDIGTSRLPAACPRIPVRLRLRAPRLQDHGGPGEEVEAVVVRALLRDSRGPHIRTFLTDHAPRARTALRCRAE